MKKLLVTAACIFFLLSLIVLAQNETNVTTPAGNATLPSSGNATAAGNTTNVGNATNVGNTGNATQAIHPAAPPSTPPAASRNASQQKATPCGNGKPDAGENCFSCPKDVKCQSGQICNTETGACDTQTNFTTYIIVGVGIFVLLGLFFFAKRMMKKKDEPVQRPPAAVQVQKPMVQQPALGQQPQQPLATNQQPMANTQPSPVAQAQIQMPPSMTQPPSMQDIAGEKDKGRAQGFQEMSEVVNEHPGETMPQKFIRQMREKGWNDERIRMKMKESGWSETQIALEFLKSPKFVKKQ